MTSTRPESEASDLPGTHTIDRTPEYEEFIADLRKFHEQRGTSFEPEPKLGANHVDLLKLFKHIMAHGGYDKVSDEKLAWRRMCENLGLMTANPPAAAFGLKSIFYKYLAAYEIKTVHNKEPPPPEILEHLTARGSGLLTRTLETFKPSRRDVAQDRSDGDDGTPSRERRPEDTPTSSSARASRGLREAPPQRVIFQPDTSSPRQARQASAAAQHATPTTQQSHPGSSHPTPHHHQHHPSQPSQQTPVPPSHGAPQSVQALQQFQPPRGGPSHGWTPPSADLQVPAVQNYQPAEPVVLPTRVVPTPSNAPDHFAQAQRQLTNGRIQPDPSQPPRIHATGPNIYLRCVTALRSGIQAEQAFGLNHLVKISFERGDKFRFEQFPALLDGLIEKALEVGRLFYHVDWSICYDPDMDDGSVGQLDGLEGTADILDRIAQLRPKLVQDSVLPADFQDQLVLITEAILTIRNMAMLPDNSLYLADCPTLKDLLCIVLNLPRQEIVVEIKHFALDIAEQVTPNLILASDDPLYQTLLAQLLDSTDRGIILTALRAVGRISMNFSETNKLGGVPPGVLRNIMNWLLLNDDELMDACLDFLYQYTAVVSNVETLLSAVAVENLVSHLVRLLSHGAKRDALEIVIEPERKLVGGEHVVDIPRDLFERLLATEEPDRCYLWLRCLFEEDPDSQITQIAIWQAYTNAFLEPLKRSGRGLINAAEFIRNISQVYQNAGARIVRDQGPMGKVEKFIISGIRPRPRPIAPDGREYFRCLWARKNPTAPAPPGGGGAPPPKCGAWFASPEAMYEHVLLYHLEQERGEDGHFRNREADGLSCRWDDCRKYPRPARVPLMAFMAHVKTHIVREARKYNGGSSSGSSGGGSAAGQQQQPLLEPGSQTPGGTSIGGGSSSSKRAKRPYVIPAKKISISYEETLTIRDERNPNAPPQAGGIPLSAILVLRNIALNVSKTESEEELLKRRGGRGTSAEEDRDNSDGEASGGGWNERLFRPMLPRLYEIMAENRYLAPHITSLLQILSDL